MYMKLVVLWRQSGSAGDEREWHTYYLPPYILSIWWR